MRSSNALAGKRNTHLAAAPRPRTPTVPIALPADGNECPKVRTPSVFSGLSTLLNREGEEVDAFGGQAQRFRPVAATESFRVESER